MSFGATGDDSEMAQEVITDGGEAFFKLLRMVFVWDRRLVSLANLRALGHQERGDFGWAYDCKGVRKSWRISARVDDRTSQVSSPEGKERVLDVEGILPGQRIFGVERAPAPGL